jgi:hypothetical protein
MDLHDPTQGPTQAKFNMPPQPTTASSPTPCSKHDCPLNEVGINHSKGIYRHEGRDASFCNVVFANSNPPPFIWQAHGRFWKAVGAESTAKGDALHTVQKVIQKDDAMVNKFLSCHGGCSCRRFGCNGHLHYLGIWMDGAILSAS